jgi:hypothetical protein
LAASFAAAVGPGSLGEGMAPFSEGWSLQRKMVSESQQASNNQATIKQQSTNQYNNKRRTYQGNSLSKSVSTTLHRLGPGWLSAWLFLQE